MDRREFVHGGVAHSLVAGVGLLMARPADGGETPGPVPEFAYEEATIEDLQRRMASGELDARAVAAAYLARIEAINLQGPELRHVIEVNPDAMAIAKSLDTERCANGPRGPLHGIPVLLKDNIDTADRNTTTAGSLALEGSIPARLRQAGAVLLGKANLSEWANIRSTRSSSGWSARGGQCRNPYALDRNPCGSSSGSAAAVSANVCAVAVGTETDGSTRPALSRADGIDKTMDAHELDAIVGPTGGPAWLTDLVNGDHFTGISSSTLPAVAGYPAITVPAGFIFGLPVGLTFFGRAWSEPALLQIAYAFEQTTRHRQPPRFRPTVDLGLA